MRKTSLAVSGLMMLAVLASACTEQDRPIERLRRYIEATERAPREIIYVEKTAHVTQVVRGQVEDDLRYQATLHAAPETSSDQLFADPMASAEGGAPVLEQVISDDALAVRILDPGRLPQLQSEAEVELGSQVVTDALMSGRWILDYQGAPPLIATRTREGSISVGQRPILDSYYVLQYVKRAIEEGQVQDFNPDRIDYNPRDDPFPHPKEDLGVTRFDVVPPQLPRRSERGTEQALTSTAHFRKMAIYVRQGKVIRVLEQIEIEEHEEFRRAREGRRPKYYLDILEQVLQGRTREPIRERRIAIEFKFPGEFQVTLPVQEALAANLGELFGPKGLAVARGPSEPEPEMGGGAGTEETQPADAGGESSESPADTGAENSEPPAG